MPESPPTTESGTRITKTPAGDWIPELFMMVCFFWFIGSIAFLLSWFVFWFLGVFIGVCTLPALILAINDMTKLYYVYNPKTGRCEYFRRREQAESATHA